MRSPIPLRAPDERGFILVGVVTFMLALTILGLSLFALSSYEAQFFVASAAREQSLQNSESGMELVKTLIAAPGTKRLENAHRAEGQLGITSALAYQWRNGDTTSAGPVDWDTTLVLVVSARSGGVERALQATFIPSVRENPYERLLAAGNGVSVNTVNSSSPSVLELSGRVWQPVESDADTAWTDHVEWNAGAPIERGTPPAPLTDAFFSQHLPSAQKPDDDDFDHDDNGYSLKLSGSSMGTFFRSPDSPTRENEEDHDEFREYEFYVGAPLDISVRRVAVWLVPEGACFRRRVTIEADVPSTLVIVAGPNGREPGRENRGIWFKDGLRIQDGVQVYLVSSGDISLVHRRGSDNTNNAETVSIVAGGWIEIGGPESSDTFRLGYDADSMDALTEQLLALGALPQVVGGTGTTFAVAPQSWVEITPK